MVSRREVVWRQGRPGEDPLPRPATGAEARRRLDLGSTAFAAVGRDEGSHVVTVGPDGWVPGLHDPPADDAGLADVLRHAAAAAVLASPVPARAGARTGRLERDRKADRHLHT